MNHIHIFQVGQLLQLLITTMGYMKWIDKEKCGFSVTGNDVIGTALEKSTHSYDEG